MRFRASAVRAHALERLSAMCYHLQENVVRQRLGRRIVADPKTNMKRVILVAFVAIAAVLVPRQLDAQQPQPGAGNAPYLRSWQTS